MCAAVLGALGALSSQAHAYEVARRSARTAFCNRTSVASMQSHWYVDSVIDVSATHTFCCWNFTYKKPVLCCTAMKGCLACLIHMSVPVKVGHVTTRRAPPGENSSYCVKQARCGAVSTVSHNCIGSPKVCRAQLGTAGAMTANQWHHHHLQESSKPPAKEGGAETNVTS